MKNLYEYINEKYLIDIDSNDQFSKEEMMKDYNEVSGAYTKSEKKNIADKYGCTKLRIRDIQLVILDELKKLRQTQKEFDDIDFSAFIRQEVPTVYDKLKKYLDEEPIEFVEYLFKHWENMVNKNKRIQQYKYYPNGLSIADRNTLKWYNNLKKYLDENK